MAWLRRKLGGEHGHESATAPVASSAPVVDPADLVPPKLPHVELHDPAAAHARTYASKICPTCQAPLTSLPRTTVVCHDCGNPIVVLDGEDGRWHLLREDEVSAFDARQEEIRAERYAADEAILREAGFLIGDQPVDVVEEADYQDVLERLAGGRSRSGAMSQVVALLSREPGHRHDKNAIRVDVDGETVGYIEKWNAKSIQPLMQKLEREGRPAWVRGTIVGGWDHDQGDDSFRIRLDGLPAA